MDKKELLELIEDMDDKAEIYIEFQYFDGYDMQKIELPVRSIREEKDSSFRTKYIILCCDENKPNKS